MKKTITKNSPCFIIAEAGVNHNGDLTIAKKLVDAAKEAKADAIKFQTYKTEDLVTKTSQTANYQKENTKTNQTQFEMLKKLELQYEDFKELKEYCDKKEIIFLSTPHTESSLEFLKDLVPIFKIGSGDLNNLPLLEKIAKLKKPIILSTGMASFEEIEESITLIKKYNEDIIVLHCTTSYPCPLDKVNLLTMLEIERKFNVLTGYSDHTEGIEVPIIAASLGATVIEKHFTLDKNMQGPDHKASLNPEELKEMIEKIRNNTILDIPKKILGNRNKIIEETEREISKIARKSIIANVDIKKGTNITEEMLIIKRPGTGISPKYFNEIINKKTKKDITKDTILSWDDLE